MRIGVFDSGIGGEAIAQALQASFPDAEFLVVNDKTHLPYGDKSTNEIIELTDAAIQPLLAKSCDAIIIACNSATTAAIKTLRESYPNQVFIGVEPMIKTAAKLTKSNVIAVCATPATIKSERYKELVDHFGSHLTILEPDCSNWAAMIEDIDINQQSIDDIITDCIKKGADVIVLGCTHYHWIKQEIIEAAQGATILEPSETLGKRLHEILGV